MRILEHRALTLFLDTVEHLSARVSLDKYEQDFLWRPHIDKIPFPWTLTQERIWVETSSIFINDKLIIREISKKEQAQIIDLLTDWASFFVEECWKCNHGQSPPLRLLYEIGTVGAACRGREYYFEDYYFL